MPLAKRFFKIVLKLNLFVSFSLSFITFLLRKQIAALFTADTEVRNIVSLVLILLSCNFLVDGMQGFL